MRFTILMLWQLFTIASNSFLIVSVQAMEPDEELLRSPQFLTQHNCLLGYFDVPKLFKAEKWNEAVNLIETLKRGGRNDRYLTESKVQALIRMGRFNDALIELKGALTQEYLCDITEPRFPVADDQTAIRNALTWYNIHNIYKHLNLNQQSDDAYKKADTLMRQALKSYSGLPDFDLKIQGFLNANSFFNP